MADNETQINLRFKVNDDGSIVLDKIGKSIQKVEDNTTRMNSSLGVIKLDSLINLGERAYRTGQQIYDLARSTASAANDIERQAKILNMSTDEFQKWEYAAKMADVEIQTLATGFKFLARNMEEASKGTGTAKDYFDAMGISVKGSTGNLRPMNEMMKEIMDKFASWEEGPRKIAISLALFGRSGNELIPFLNQGSKGFEEMAAAAAKMGIVVDENILKRESEMEDVFKNWESRWKSFKFHALDAIMTVLDQYEKLLKVQALMSESKYLQAFKALTGGIPKETAVTEKGKPTGEAPIIQSAEAMKAMSSALEKNAEYEAKLNAYYADDVELLKQANREVERRAKGIDIMEQLGIKTKIGAEREISGIQEKYKSLMGQGYSREEMERARAKLEEQLRAVESKYKAESGWKGIGEEGGVQWWSNIMPKEGVGRDITDMVKKGIDELNRMQEAAERATGPKQIMIDYSPVQNANQAVEELRKKLDAVDGRVITITIDQRIKGDQIEAIEENLATRFSNKQSRLGSIIRKEIEGTIYYGNE